MRDFFISYNKADKGWAEWIAWQLEEAGYTTILQAWDFRPSENFVIKMNDAVRDSERTVAILSPDYLAAGFTQSEWAAAFAQDPTSAKGLLLPIRVRECDTKGLFSQIIYVDLVGRDEDEAKKALISGVQRGRAKPNTKPGFPGGVPRSISVHPLFPGRTARKMPFTILAAITIFSALILFVMFIWRPRSLTNWLEPPRPCAKFAGATSRYYEAEVGAVSGGASIDSEHRGFSGDGYVSGFGGSAGADATFLIDAHSDGEYQVDLCYANGTNSAKTLTIYVNEEPLRQTRLPNADRWNVWLTQTESLPLKVGPNKISYRKTSTDNGQVNLDFIRVASEPSSFILTQPTPTKTPTATPVGTADTSKSFSSPSRSPRKSKPNSKPCSAEDRLFGRC